MTAKTWPLAAVFSLIVALPGAAAAQSAGADATLYRELGERAGLERLMNHFVPQLKADPRTAEHFKESKVAHLAKQLTDQVCVITGGPCVYDGASMKDAHADYKVRRADFNALVEQLQNSMDAQAIPFGVQNRLLALLAPMHRDVINTR